MQHFTRVTPLKLKFVNAHLKACTKETLFLDVISDRHPKVKKQGQDLKFKQRRNQANPHWVDNMHIHEGRLSLGAWGFVWVKEHCFAATSSKATSH